jgi:hypothetical protein
MSLVWEFYFQILLSHISAWQVGCPCVVAAQQVVTWQSPDMLAVTWHPAVQQSRCLPLVLLWRGSFCCLQQWVVVVSVLRGQLSC